MVSPTLSLCDCPNGCVVLRFGYVTVHLPRAAFLLFASRVEATAAALVSGGGPAAPEH